MGLMFGLFSPTSGGALSLSLIFFAAVGQNIVQYLLFFMSDLKIEFFSDETTMVVVFDCHSGLLVILQK